MALMGFEVNWSQQFTFLPGFLSGFGIYRQLYLYPVGGRNTGPSKKPILPGQASVMSGNFALSYEKGGFTGRFGVNYHGKFIDGSW